MIKLNLGCGHDRRPGFINIDADRRVKPDIIHDLTQALPVANRSVDLILLQDILEHLTIQEVEILIKNCAQVLKITGQLEIRIPNVYAIVSKFYWQPDLMMLYLYGDTTKSGRWGAHRSGYTPELLKELGSRYHLRLTKLAKIDTNYLVRFQKVPRLLPAQITLRDRSQAPIGVMNIKEWQWFRDRSVIVCHDWLTYLMTPWWRVVGRVVVWYLSPSFQLNGYGLRYFWKLWSRLTQLLIVKNQADYRSVINNWHYSHLRIVKLNRGRPG